MATPIDFSIRACCVKRPRITWIVDSLCIAMLIGTTVYAVCRYATLPERIPVHYNAKGVIDGYGGKGMIWLLLAGMWGVVGCLSFVEQFPKCWNTVFRTTKENHVQMLSLTWTLISITKLIVAAMFAYLVMAAIRGGNLPALFMPIVLLALGANFLYWLVRAFFLAMRQKTRPLNMTEWR